MSRYVDLIGFIVDRNALCVCVYKFEKSMNRVSLYRYIFNLLNGKNSNQSCSKIAENFFYCFHINLKILFDGNDMFYTLFCFF